ncbi:DUF937 domain-containing protein [Moheibacter sediminis]|uniref:DUF937 domain-containing protein n=1 Tax=Moheibacter sediminis TaxID=1434700 RepID=A0A1W1YZ72_9FLAO|nr:DUF937 domain-containing protein [Moheibacter sediminis]SMC41382.1 protein of unknown function [Moheibacter sediminis]
MDISHLLQGPVGQQLVSGVVSQLGIKNEQAQMAISAAIPFLLTALNKNAANGDAQNINKALETKHDGSILDNLGGFLSSGNFSDGAGILGHVLGGKQSQVENAIGQSSGLNGGQVAQLLAMLAPIVMGYLGKEKNSQGLDAGGLTGLLGGLVGGAAQTNQREMSTIEKLLDQDGDGSAMDDVMDIGSKLLGGFFKK